MTLKKLYSPLIFLFFFTAKISFSQFCDPTTPTFTVDLTGNPDSLWNSPSVVRDGLCCTASNPDRCVQFLLTLDQDAVGIEFTVCDGALPPGALYYQVDCGTPQPVGTPLCLAGDSSYVITFCKPGNNNNEYCIQSISKPDAGPPIAVSDGCMGYISATGFDEPTIVWTSISPGAAGDYNSYMSCTSACDTVLVTAQPGYPPSVLYQVTGVPVGACASMSVSDTVRVYFINDKTATITPPNPVVCIGVSNAVLTANGTGGAQPYSYLWSTGATTQSITTGVGTYWVQISDTTNCPPVYDTIVVTTVDKPVTDFAATVACANAPINFSDLTTSTAGAVTGWDWNFGDGNTSTLQNPSNIYLASGNYTVTLVSYTGFGCADTMMKAITVTPLPVASFTSNSLCYTDSVLFTNTSTVSSGSVTGANWNFGDAGTSAQLNPYHVYTTGGNHTVTLVAVTSSGCSDTVSMPVNIQSVPDPDFVASLGCEQSNISFTDSSSVIAGTITGWSWNFGNGNTSTQQNPTNIYAPSGTYTVTLIVSTAFCSDTLAMPVSVSPKPVASFVSDTACHGDLLAFTNTSTLSVGNFASWNWDFGDTSAASSLQNPSHLFNYPGTHTITLIAVSDAGCSDTVSLTSIVQPNPVPDFAIFPACANTTINFSDSTTIISGTLVNWSWNFGDGNTANTQNPVHTYNADGNYNVTLIVSSAANCTDTIVKTVTVNPNPVPGFILNTPCYTDSVSFTNSSSISSGSITSYLWNFGDSTTSTLQNPNHFYNYSGNHVVTLIAYSALGCSDTISQVIDIQPAPVADFAFSLPCANALITFNDSSSISSGSITGWSWNFGDGNTANSQNPSNIYLADGNYNVSLIVTSAANCVDTIIKTIAVNPTPVPAFSTNTPCYIDSVSFTNSSSISSGSITNWSWNFGDSTTSTLQNPNHFYNYSGNHVVTLVAVSALGCSDTINQVIDVQPVPAADFVVSSPCANALITFYDSSSISSGSITGWSWNFGDGNTAVSQNPSHTYLADGNYNVSLIVTSAANCIDTINKTIAINPTPVPAFSTNTPCYIDSVSFTNSSSISSGSITNWYWNFGDSTTSTLQNPNHFYNYSGNHVVTLVAVSALGCSDTLSQVIDVQPVPAADFVVSSPCANALITFYDSSSISSGSITGWSWNFGDGNTAGSQNPSHTYLADGNYNVSLIVTSAANCIDTINKTIAINPTPVPAFSTNTPCYIDSVSFTNSSSISSGSITNWYWNFGDSTTSALQNPNHFYNYSGNHVVTLVAVSALGCSDTINQVIDVQPVPVADFVISSPCANELITLYDSTFISSGTITAWSWNFGDGNTATSQNPSHMYSADGNYNVSLIVTSAGNCSDTINKTITINPLPVTAFTANNPCFVDSVFFTDNSTISSGTVNTWNWNFGDGTTGTQQNPGHYYSAVGNYTVTLVSVSAAGCSDTATQIINVQPMPVADFNNNAATCVNSSLTFTDSSTISSGTIISWSWNFGDGNSSSVLNPVHVYSAPGTYPVSLIIVSGFGCVDTTTKMVTVAPLPSAAIVSAGMCLGDGTQFTDASVVSSGSVVAWIWLFGDSGSDTLQNVLHYYPSPGTYSVTLMVETDQGCKDTAYATAVVNPSPVAGFSASPTIVNLFQTVYFTDNSVDAVSWLWNFGDSAQSTLTNPTHQFSQGGTFSVMEVVINSYGCPDTAYQDIVVTMPPLVPNGFSPNGDGNNDILFVPGGPFKEMNFRIYNSWGELIFISTKQSNGWDGTRDGIDQPVGVYVFTLDVKTEDDKEHHLKGDVTLIR